MAQEARRQRFPGYRETGSNLELLGGRYEIQGLLASGGMAEVYQGRDTVLDRRVAIKILHATYGNDAEFVERFRREAMAAGRLNHPNIVQVYDWGRSEDGKAYMVMELVEGKTLRQILNEQGPLPVKTAARIAEHVASALDVARRSGIVHRDIKPENILISPDGRARVADFGVARALAESRATQAGTVLGTAAYLAPEQVEGQAGDHRADLYSLGTMFYEMLTGSTPFGGDNPVVVAYRRVKEDVPAPAGAPKEISAVIARATSRNPDERYQTAGQLIAALSPVTGTSPAELLDPADDGHTRAIPLAAAETTVIRRRVPRKRMRRLLRLIVAIAVALAMIPLGVRFFGKVTVPNVAGLTQEAATRLIEQAGLKTDPVLKYHVTVAQGSVISLTPGPGSKVRRGTEITMAVSLGPALATVPDVKNRTLAQATALLEKANLKVVVREAFHATKKGLVFYQDPLAQQIVKEGTEVRVTVSKGPEQIAVPSVNGKSMTEASEVLRGAGFGVVIARVDSETVPRDVVVSTTPTGGQKADRGSAVTLNVSNGPSEFPAPDVRGERYSDAVAILARVSLKATRKQVPGSAGDTVVSQVPREGKKVKRGDTIILYTA